MGLFKTKADKEIEKKLIIKKTINSMNKQIAELEVAKKNYLEKAKRAKLKGLEAPYNLAVSGYRMTVGQLKRAEEMLLNFELTSQIKDMSKLTQDFLGSLSILSKEMMQLTKNRDFLKVQKEFEKAMLGVEERTEKMDVFMDMTEEGFKNAHVNDNSLTDEELEKMIEEDAESEELSPDDIDNEIKDLKKKLETEV